MDTGGTTGGPGAAEARRAVYVDTAIHPWHGHLWCHMWADEIEDLHAMADRLGISRRRFQQPPRARWLHYDLSAEQRRRAIRLGAVATDRYGALEHRARRDGDAAMLARLERLRARKEADASEGAGGA